MRFGVVFSYHRPREECERLFSFYFEIDSSFGQVDADEEKHGKGESLHGEAFVGNCK